MKEGQEVPKKKKPVKETGRLPPPVESLTALDFIWENELVRKDDREEERREPKKKSLSVTDG